MRSHGHSQVRRSRKNDGHSLLPPLSLSPGKVRMYVNNVFEVRVKSKKSVRKLKPLLEVLIG